MREGNKKNVLKAGCPARRPCMGGFEFSSATSFRHDAVKPNATSIQIRLRISRITSSSLKQLWVGAGGRALIPKDAFGWWVAFPRVLGKHHRSEFARCWNSPMAETYNGPSTDEYLRKRLMPVEGAIPHVQGIEMYGNSIPAGTVGGDLFEYINFQQRYDIDARIQRALKRSKEYLEALPAGAAPRNSVDNQVEWLKSRPGYKPEMETEYRAARSSEQVSVAEDLHELYSTAGFLVVDAEGHGIISAKITSTLHHTFHPPMLSQLHSPP